MSSMRVAWLALLLIFSVQGISAEPRLVIAGNRFDFGTTPQHATLTQYFWFHSVGTDTVKITEVETGCDCTTMPLERTILAPGDSMKVGVNWDTQASVGSSGKYPRIHIAGQHDPERLFMTASVTLFPDSARPISIKPFRAELSKMSSRSVDSMRIMLTNHSELPVALKVTSAPMAEYRLTVPDSLRAKETVAMVLAVAPEYQDKEFSRSVTLKYDGGAVGVTGNITVPVRRKIIS